MLILIDKPRGCTSYDVIRAMKRTLGKRKIGHSGTLDPMATGLLIIGVDDGCKQLQSVQDSDKRYTATVNLSGTSTTGDEEGEITPVSGPVPTPEQVTEAVQKFIGEIRQTPSIYSAIKIKGKPAYRYAREGKEVDIPERTVHIRDIQIKDYSFPDLTLDVRCSKGTYIRTLGEDLGKSLGLGGYLTMLRRTEIGPYNVRDARTIIM